MAYMGLAPAFDRGPWRELTAQGSTRASACTTSATLSSLCESRAAMGPPPQLTSTDTRHRAWLGLGCWIVVALGWGHFMKSLDFFGGSRDEVSLFDESGGTYAHTYPHGTAVWWRLPNRERHTRLTDRTVGRVHAACRVDTGVYPQYRHRRRGAGPRWMARLHDYAWRDVD